jgi:hypothetical protein
MIARKSIIKSIYLLVLPLVGLTTSLTLPATALDEKRECNLYGIYANDELRVVHSRTNVVLDLTNTIFDPPMDRATQVQRCKKALNESIEQQLQLDMSFCPTKAHNLVGFIKSGGELTEVVRAQAVYRTGIVTDTEYRPVLICEINGPNRCRNVYRPMPYQVERRVSSCRLSF